MKIYHVHGTRSVLPIWLCYELDLPLEIQPIDFSSAYRDSPEWRTISPPGKVPALCDGDLSCYLQRLQGREAMRHALEV